MLSERKKKFFIQLGVVILVAFALQLFQGFIISSPRVSAAVDELHGWIWSSNVGWVSMNCADTAAGCSGKNYSVRVNSGTGLLSGYAWSSNIGWIQFDASGPYPEVPQRPAQIDNPGAVSSPLSGWARALSNNVLNGGWDGWIKMSGSASGGGSYGVSINGNQFSGFAWGSAVLGWMNFDAVTRSGGASPACPTFTASPRTIVVAVPGGSGDTTLSWQCVNVNPNSCSIDEGVGPVAESGSRQVTISHTTTFTLSCSVGSGATAQTFVEVQAFTPTRKEIRP